jgi:hypothetical protein
VNDDENLVPWRVDPANLDKICHLFANDVERALRLTRDKNDDFFWRCCERTTREGFRLRDQLMARMLDEAR